MEFLKKHYEKIILSVVLLGLAVAAALLPLALSRAREHISGLDKSFPPPKPRKPINLSTNEMIIARLKSPPKIELSGEHNLFNPVVWKQFPDGRLKKVPTSNPAELLVPTQIFPLNLTIAFDRVAGSGYYFNVLREAMLPRAAFRKQQKYAKAGDKVTFPGPEGKALDLFTLKEVKGPAEDPTEFIIELADTRELVAVTKQKPYVRVEAYGADLKYDLGNKKFPDTRRGATLAFEGDTYNVIAILRNEVRVQAFSNQKITTVTLKSAP